MKAIRTKTGTLKQFSTAIPSYYNKRTLRILPCNPLLLYAYWEIPECDKNGSFILRISSISSNSGIPDVITQLPFNNDVQSSYIRIPREAIRYLFEIARIDTNETCSVLCSTEFSLFAKNRCLTEPIHFSLDEENNNFTLPQSASDTESWFDDKSLPIVSVSFTSKPQTDTTSHKTDELQNQEYIPQSSGTSPSSWIFQ